MHATGSLFISGYISDGPLGPVPRRLRDVREEAKTARERRRHRRA